MTVIEIRDHTHMDAALTVDTFHDALVGAIDRARDVVVATCSDSVVVFGSEVLAVVQSAAADEDIRVVRLARTVRL